MHHRFYYYNYRRRRTPRIQIFECERLMHCIRACYTTLKAQAGQYRITFCKNAALFRKNFYGHFWHGKLLFAATEQEEKASNKLKDHILDAPTKPTSYEEEVWKVHREEWGIIEE